MIRMVVFLLMLADCQAQKLLSSTVPAEAIGGSSFVSGMIVFMASGGCPAEWGEVSSLGNYLLLTTAAAGDVGTTGGSNSYTPAGTVAAPVFTGTSSQATSLVSAGTPTGTNSTVSFTPVGTVAWPAGVPTFSGNSGTVPAQAFTGSSGTIPAETISWPAGVPTHSGTTISDHASHTHTYTDVPNHVHVENINTATTGGASGFPALVDTSTGGSSALGLSTANNTGGVATGTTNGPSATLTHTVSSQGTVAWPAGVPTNATVNFTPAGTNGTVSFTPAGAVAWPAGVPTLSGSPGTVPAETFTGSSLGTHSHTLTPAGTNSAPGFTGNAATLQPTYLKVIPCQKL